MPLRPIDMQVILPRVQSFKNAKETILQKDVNTIHQQKITNAEDTDKQMKQVNKYEQKSEEKIKDDNENKGSNYTKNAKKKKSDDDEDEEELKGKSKGLGYHRFDMKV